MLRCDSFAGFRENTPKDGWFGMPPTAWVVAIVIAAIYILFEALTW